jgi:CMP-N-acetylneuraminic acid synthetase
MDDNEKVLAVIPARGDSKGIPRKNLYPLNGKPLIAYTIEAALKSKLLTRSIISTDSEEIAEVAEKFGGDVPFIRPNVLANDTASSIDVVKHAVKELEKADGVRYNYAVLLQPTTPLRLSEDIDKVVQKLISTQCDTVITMVDVGAFHPARMYRIENDRLVGIMEESIAMRRRQDLPPIYIRSGDVYACKRDIIFNRNSMLGNDCRPLVISPNRAINIDTLRDIVLAEYLLRV